MPDLDRIIQEVADQAPAIVDVYAAQTAVPPSQWPRELEPFAGTPWEDPVTAEVRAHEVNWALSVGQNPATFDDFVRQSAILMREGIGENFEGLASAPAAPYMGDTPGAFVFRGSGNTVQVVEVDAAEVAAIAQKALQIANGEEPKPSLDDFTQIGLPATIHLDA